uniref:Uncharacterized protein n=1 Tax=Lutzomyia longipalpis TaxID=7200 RepID=A0A1B0CGH9_LUTLO
MYPKDRKGASTTSTSASRGLCVISNFRITLRGKSFNCRIREICASTSTPCFVGELEIVMEGIHQIQHCINIIPVHRYQQIINILPDTANSERGHTESHIQQSLHDHISNDRAYRRAHGNSVQLQVNLIIVREVSRRETQIQHAHEVLLLNLRVTLNLVESTFNLFQCKSDRDVCK